MENKMITNLKENTGKSLEDWIEIVKKTGLAKHGEILKYLKQDHGFTHGFANLVAHKALKSDAGSHNEDDLIAGMFSKGKEELKPIYDNLIAHINKFGEVKIAPKRAYVSIIGKKQFAILQPSTKTRFDVGINIKGKEPTERLEKSGSFNAMVSHRVRLTSAEQVDDQLISWLKEAYELSK
ncbi:MAG: DUF5655 domain-containing protein [Bacteroidota bacterium]